MILQVIVGGQLYRFPIVLSTQRNQLAACAIAFATAAAKDWGFTQPPDPGQMWPWEDCGGCVIH